MCHQNHLEYYSTLLIKFNKKFCKLINSKKKKTIYCILEVRKDKNKFSIDKSISILYN